jgi:uncharacterized membrane protein YhaH (DUF805 family)
MIWFLLALQKFADFQGRARRREFWYFKLFYALIQLGIAWIDMQFNLKNTNQMQFLDIMITSTSIRGILLNPQRLGYLSVIFTLIMVIPNLSVQVRRLHDTGRSAFWAFLNIPFVAIFLLFFFVRFRVLINYDFPFNIDVFFFSFFPYILVSIYIIPLVFCLFDSEEYANKYGLNPKEKSK